MGIRHTSHLRWLSLLRPSSKCELEILNSQPFEPRPAWSPRMEQEHLLIVAGFSYDRPSWGFGVRNSSR